MEFCDECGSMMKAQGDRWVCSQCENELDRDVEREDGWVPTIEQEETEIVDVTDAEDRGLPTTSTVCPECGHEEAYWYMQQIRAADESETRFFVCTECEYQWREDDH